MKSTSELISEHQALLEKLEFQIEELIGRVSVIRASLNLLQLKHKSLIGNNADKNQEGVSENDKV